FPLAPGGESERRALDVFVRPVDLGSRDRVDPGDGDGARVPAVQVVAQGLLDHRVAAELADDGRRGRLALAEARDADALREVGERMVERVIDVVRGDLDIEAYAVLGEFGALGLHARGRGARNQ